MSTKAASKRSSKAGSVQPGGDRVSATPERASTSRPETPNQRPISPARMQRMSERVSLQILNDRFAKVVENNKRLTNENAALKVQIQKKEERTVSQSQEVKNAYEKEIQQLRLMVDTVSKEKAQTQLYLSSAQEDLNSATISLKKKNSEVDSLTKRNAALDNEVKNLREKLSDAVDDKKRLEQEVRELKAELHRSEEQKKALRKQVEEETIARVDLENRNQSLNEELEFKSQMYQRELKEVHKKETVYTKEIHETVRSQYAKNLEEVRRENEERLELYRNELQQRYEPQIQALEKDLTAARHELVNARKNIKELNSSNVSLVSEVDRIQRDYNSVRDKLADFQKLFQQERDNYMDALEKQQQKLDAVRLELTELNQEHNDLIDEKVRIDAELNTYRQLLEQEESRLNIESPVFNPEDSLRGYSVHHTPPTRLSKRSGNKRKALELDDSNQIEYVEDSRTNGEIEIVEQDMDGKFVKINNIGKEDISVGGWILVRNADSLSVHYKFPRSVVAKPGQPITVWSSDAQATHQPPTDFVMKSQNWFTADTITTRLLKPDESEMASRETKRKETNRSGGYDFSQADRSNCILM